MLLLLGWCLLWSATWAPQAEDTIGLDYYRSLGAAAAGGRTVELAKGSADGLDDYESGYLARNRMLSYRGALRKLCEARKLEDVEALPTTGVWWRLDVSLHSETAASQRLRLRRGT